MNIQHNKKHIINILLAVFLIFSLAPSKAQDTVKIKGKIAGLKANDSIIILKGSNLNQTIKISKSGRFSDNFEIKKEGVYHLFFNDFKIPVFLKKGYKLKLKADAKDVTNTTRFKGKGKETNNFITLSTSEFKKIASDFPRLNKLKDVQLKKEIASHKVKMDRLYALENIDKEIVKKVQLDFRNVYSKLNNKKTSKGSKAKGSSRFKKGDIAPKFVDLENYNGGTTSMDDLKGKYIYIDVWATWCGPCRAQIPALKKLEEEYRDKNIEFVSISSDRKNAHDKWRRMVESKELKGIQLYFGNDKTFMRSMGIRGIPRFIFIDPEGKIVNAHAPRPSQTKQIKKMFDAAGL